MTLTFVSPRMSYQYSKLLLSRDNAENYGPNDKATLIAKTMHNLSTAFLGP